MGNELDFAPVVEVRIDEIDVGPRLRKVVKLKAAFLESIRERGLAHPITLRTSLVPGRYDLVAGHGRLEAFRALGRETVPAKVAPFDDEGLVGLELDENAMREPLSDLERSQATVEACVREWRAKTAARAEALISTESVEIGRKRKRAPGAGRKPKGEASVEALAEASGVPEQTLREAQRHAAAAERYPMLDAWKKTRALEAAKLLDAMPEPVRVATVGIAETMVSLDSRNVGDAMRVIQNVAGFAPEKQARVAELYQGDADARGLALTTAAEMPPMPDPRALEIGNIRRELGQLARMSKDELKGPIKEGVRRCDEILAELAAQVEAAHRAKVEAADGATSDSQKTSMSLPGESTATT